MCVMRPSRATASSFRGGREGQPLSRLGWTPWMWSLTLGCIAGSVWSSSPGSDSSVAAAGPPGLATSYTHPEHPFHNARHHASPISIYRSPAFLRSGHGESRQASFVVLQKSSTSMGDFCLFKTLTFSLFFSLTSMVNCDGGIIGI